MEVSEGSKQKVVQYNTSETHFVQSWCFPLTLILYPKYIHFGTFSYGCW